MAKKVKYCINCGSEINEDSSFCEECGHKIEREEKEEKEETKKVVKEEKVKETKEEPKKDVKEEEIIVTPVLNERVLKRSNDKKENNNSNIAITLIVAVLCFLFGVIFTIVYVDYAVSKSSENTNTTTNTESGSVDVTITDNGIAQAVDKVYDAVVVVKNYVRGQLYSTGTGFVYKTDDTYAYILTNHHVVSGATEVKVLFTNNEEYTVEVVGSDQYSDIALLKVSKDAIITTAYIGDSTALKVGDTTFAVGAPIDSDVYSWTVTRGILSGKDRLVEVDGSGTTGSYVMKVLQTDAAINSGNSGGPLCNANGEVIGITNMKIASSQVEGMGFAIPIETAIKYANSLLNGESTSKPYLGVSMYESANSYYTGGTGVYVAAIDESGPASKAGIKKGDIITKIGDVEVNSSAYLRYELYNYNVGDKVVITYKRNNQTYTATVTLGSQN